MVMIYIQLLKQELLDKEITLLCRFPGEFELNKPSTISVNIFSRTEYEPSILVQLLPRSFSVCLMLYLVRQSLLHILGDGNSIFFYRIILVFKITKLTVSFPLT